MPVRAGLQPSCRIKYIYIISRMKKSSIPESYKNKYQIIVEINKA